MAAGRESAVLLIVPTLCVGMQPGTLCVPFKAERGASEEAFPRRAWERSFTGYAVSDYLQTSAMASASDARRVASMPATLARPELTMYTLCRSRRFFTCSGNRPV
jgi:hypothetical protein